MDEKVAQVLASELRRQFHFKDVNVDPDDIKIDYFLSILNKKNLKKKLLDFQ